MKLHPEIVGSTSISTPPASVTNAFSLAKRKVSTLHHLNSCFYRSSTPYLFSFINLLFYRFMQTFSWTRGLNVNKHTINHDFPTRNRQIAALQINHRQMRGKQHDNHPRFIPMPRRCSGIRSSFEVLHGTIAAHKNQQPRCPKHPTTFINTISPHMQNLPLKHDWISKPLGDSPTIVSAHKLRASLVICRHFIGSRTWTILAIPHAGAELSNRWPVRQVQHTAGKLLRRSLV